MGWPTGHTQRSRDYNHIQLLGRLWSSAIGQHEEGQLNLSVSAAMPGGVAQGV